MTDVSSIGCCIADRIRFSDEIYRKEAFDVTYETDGKGCLNGQYSLLGVLQPNGSCAFPYGVVQEYNAFVASIILLLYRSGVSKGHIGEICRIAKHDELPSNWSSVVRQVPAEAMDEDETARVTDIITQQENLMESTISHKLIERRTYDRSLLEDERSPYTLVVVYVLYTPPCNQGPPDRDAGVPHWLLLQTSDERMAVPCMRPERETDGSSPTAVDVAQDVLWTELQIPQSMIKVTMSDYYCTRRIKLHDSQQQNHHQFIITLEDYVAYRRLVDLSIDHVLRLGHKVTGYSLPIYTNDSNSRFMKLWREGGSLIQSVDVWSNDVLVVLVHLHIVQQKDIGPLCDIARTDLCNPAVIGYWARRLSTCFADSSIIPSQYICAVNNSKPRFMTHTLLSLCRQYQAAKEQLQRLRSRRDNPMSDEEYKEVLTLLEATADFVIVGWCRGEISAGVNNCPRQHVLQKSWLEYNSQLAYWLLPSCSLQTNFGMDCTALAERQWQASRVNQVISYCRVSTHAGAKHVVCAVCIVSTVLGIVMRLST